MTYCNTTKTHVLCSGEVPNIIEILCMEYIHQLKQSFLISELEACMQLMSVYLKRKSISN